ncbi:MAG: hypothetical protein AAF688_12095 [Bacteroidota bacterium]
MNTITKYVVLIILSLIATGMQAQNTEKSLDSTETADVNSRVAALLKLKESIKDEERDFLKKEVENINKRLEANEITKEIAEQLKKEAAEKRALNIEDRLAIVDNKIALIKRNGDYTEEYSFDTENSSFKISFGGDGDNFSFIDINKKNKPKKYDRRTTSDLVFTIGVNNALIDGQELGDTYSVLGSGFVELGWSWKTRLLSNSNAIRLRYGFSFQWNKFTPKDDRYFVQDGNTTTLETFPGNLNEAEFRITNLVLPVFFEFGPSRKIERDTYFRYTTRRQFKVGIGAYGGFRIGTQQKLRFKEDGDRVKQKTRRNFNATDIVYGLHGYVGVGNISLFAKYDLNTVFKDQAIDQHMVSMGVRFDFD